MADWKKILFEGSNIHVAAITASHLAHDGNATSGNSFPVLSINQSTGIVTQLDQNTLSTQAGNTLFTISASDNTSNSDFNASSDTLAFAATPISAISAIVADSGTTSSITLKLADGFISSSQQLNLINYTTEDDSLAPIGWNTTLGPISTSAHALSASIVALTPQVINNAIYQNTPTNNLWYGGGGPIGNLSIDSPVNGIHWLSASFVGGFSNGTPSLSSSLGEFTGSVNSDSASIAILLLSQSQFSLDSGSMLLQANTGSLLNSVTAKEVFSINKQQNVAQVTLEDYQTQGKQIKLGTPNAINPNRNDLTILGNFNAGALALNTDGLVLTQENVSTINSSTIIGTSSAHTHAFHGQTFISGGLSVSGSITFTTPFPNANPALTGEDNITFVVYDADTGQLGKTVLNGSTNGFQTPTALGAAITASVAPGSPLSASFALRINNILSQIGGAGTDQTAINNLISGYNVLSGSIAAGIFFATASDSAAMEAGNVTGSSIGTEGTASFSATEVLTGTSAGSPTLTSTYNATNNTVTYSLNTSSFAFAALNPNVAGVGLFTSSLSIVTATEILARYGVSGSGILTGSGTNGAFTDANITYIQELASTLPNGSGKQFLTGSGSPVSGGGDFFDMVNLPDGGESLINSAGASSNSTQGVIEFSLTGSVVFGATASKMDTTGEPSFGTLTIGTAGDPNDGKLEVLGSLTRINTTNLNVKDQFILVNSGSTQDGLASSNNDKDGGIIVGGGGESGSLLMYDFTAKSWGIRGATTTNIPSTASSDSEETIFPEVTIRAIQYGDSVTPPADSEILYGIASANTVEGTMYISNTETPEPEVFIYA